MAFTLVTVNRKPYIEFDHHVEVESHGDDGNISEVFMIMDRNSDAGNGLVSFLQANSSDTIYSLNYRDTGGQLYIKIETDVIKIGIGFCR